MSWHATLVVFNDDRSKEVEIGSWNYTHNTSPMIYKVLTTLGIRVVGWWQLLDGCSGKGGAEYLAKIVGGLMEAPELFRSMNPQNGWGDYDSLLKVLEDMRRTSAEWDWGEWRCWG